MAMVKDWVSRLILTQLILAALPVIKFIQPFLAKTSKKLSFSKLTAKTRKIFFSPLSYTILNWSLSTGIIWGWQWKTAMIILQILLLITTEILYLQSF